MKLVFVLIAMVVGQNCFSQQASVSTDQRTIDSLRLAYKKLGLKRCDSMRHRAQVNRTPGTAQGNPGWEIAIEVLAVDTSSIQLSWTDLKDETYFVVGFNILEEVVLLAKSSANSCRLLWEDKKEPALIIRIHSRNCRASDFRAFSSKNGVIKDHGAPPEKKKPTKKWQEG